MDNQLDSQFSHLPEWTIDSIVDVVVDKTANYGLWCKKDGIEILILLPEISWNIYESRAYSQDLDSSFTAGETIRVKIVRFVPEKNQYVASIKGAQPELDPKIHPGYFVGAVWKGRIDEVREGGSAGEPFRTVVIDLLPGRLQGFLNVSLDDTVFEPDQNVHVRILEIQESQFHSGRSARIEFVSPSEVETVFEADPSEWEKTDRLRELLHFEAESL